MSSCHTLLGSSHISLLGSSHISLLGSRQALAAAEINARRGCAVVTKFGLHHPACRALPEPGLVVHDLDLFALKQLGAGGQGHRVLVVPLLEMNEDLVVGLAAIVGLGNHVNSLHCAEIQSFNHAVQILAGRALEHARNADAGLVDPNMRLLIWLLLIWLLLFLFLLRLLFLFLIFAENVGRIGEKLLW